MRRQPDRSRLSLRRSSTETEPPAESGAALKRSRRRSQRVRRAVLTLESLERKMLLSAPPTVATGAASSITLTGATLNATVNPNGSTTTALFQYSTSPLFTPTVATTVGSGYSQPVGVAVDPFGDVFVSDLKKTTIYEVLANGTTKNVGSGFNTPRGVAVDATGDVFVADSANNAIKEVLPSGTIKTIGSGFSGPYSVAVDAGGDVFVADSGHNVVKEVLPDGTINTIGTGFNEPYGVAVDAAGDVYVADYGNNAVKEVLPNANIITIGSGFIAPRDVAVDAVGDRLRCRCRRQQGRGGAAQRHHNFTRLRVRLPGRRGGGYSRRCLRRRQGQLADRQTLAADGQRDAVAA